MPYAIEFKPRWREELEAISEEGVLLFEFTAGPFHVYFPDEKRWETQVPAWAKAKWNVYENACREWCNENKIPMTVVNDAYVSEKK